MKKSLVIFTSVFVLFLTFSLGAFAATKYNFTFNGNKENIDVQVINNQAYVPLKSVVKLFGGTLSFDSKTKTYSVKSNTPNTSTTTTNTNPSTTQNNNIKTIDNVTIKLDKVVQDSDSLKIYVTYINKSKKEAMTGDSLAKIVANGKQYKYNSEFNFDRYYEKPVSKAADFIESGVTESSVIFFSPVNADKINIVLNANFEDYRFNDVKIEK